MSKKGPMPTVTFDGKTYKMLSRNTPIPDLQQMKRIEALLWLNQHTRAKGYSSRPNPLAGFGNAISVN